MVACMLVQRRSKATCGLDPSKNNDYRVHLLLLLRIHARAYGTCDVGLERAKMTGRRW